MDKTWTNKNLPNKKYWEKYYISCMCMDSIYNDPQFVLGLYVTGPNNKFVKGGLKG